MWGPGQALAMSLVAGFYLVLALGFPSQLGMADARLGGPLGLFAILLNRFGSVGGVELDCRRAPGQCDRQIYLDDRRRHQHCLRADEAVAVCRSEGLGAGPIR